MRESLFEILDSMEPAIAATRNRRSPDDIKSCFAGYAHLVIIASGNSQYPARYFEWLLRKATPVPASFLTPLEYVLTPPQYAHAVVLFSQGARRGDSVSIEKACEKRGVPLFLVCGEEALNKDSVAARLIERHGPERVFTTYTGRERAFLNFRGTAAAFVPAYEIAAALGAGLPVEFPAVDWDRIRASAAEYPLTEDERLFVCYGPAGRAAAEAFAGYHIECMGPVGLCDMKSFTHGVWRGLKEAGRHTLLLVEDHEVAPLAEHLFEILREDHRCLRVSVSPPPHWAAEPLALFGVMTYLWAEKCASFAETHPDWFPLYAHMTRFERYRGINHDFDVSPPAQELT